MADRLGSYRAKRDFTVTPEPAPSAQAGPGTRLFVVQKHAARRAGLHYDFRLEHDGVLWSWAVPKGPSLDPADRRMAIHVEDHPLDYADFQGDIPDGEYGAGHVETWDRGTWEPLEDPASGMAQGHLRFVLHGERLQGRFSLVRSHRMDPRKPEAWLLIKAEEAAAPTAPGPPRPAPRAGAKRTRIAAPLAPPKPELCTLVDAPPEGEGWLSEIKFDGYRIIAVIDGGAVQLRTRNGLDWADRMPRLAAAFSAIPATTAILDGELVALDPKGASSFPALQAALKAGRDDTLVWYGFDLLHLDGTDWTGAPLHERKAALQRIVPWSNTLRYSDHVANAAAAMLSQACGMGLEGIVCKRADAPYRPGRGNDWVKVKCVGREEFAVIGFTPPSGSREGLGALQLGYYDPSGTLHYAGAVGTGFTAPVLRSLRAQLDPLVAEALPGMLVSGDPVDRTTVWVEPKLVAEVRFAAWSGAGRLRHAAFLGLRADKEAEDIVREPADPEAARGSLGATGTPRRGWHGAVPPRPREAAMAAKPPAPPRTMATPAPGSAVLKPSKAPTRPAIVVASKPQAARASVGHVEISHPDRPLWPGISKRDLAEYWQAVAPAALPGLAARPLSILRCPGGIAAEQFFQKNGHGYLPPAIREGRAGSLSFIAIDDADGLYAMSQMSAIELHAWGAPETDPDKPDILVFDLDPGEGVAFSQVVEAAHDVRERLRALKLESLCRTTGGKGLHVVVPLRPEAGWGAAKPFCRAFAEAMSADSPERYLAHLKIADRTGKILIDWLRNGKGSTAIASFSPRARPGAGVATPLTWDEVTPTLDPAAFTLRTVPQRLAGASARAWADMDRIDQTLPRLPAPARTPSKAPASPAPATPTGRTRIVVAHKPKPRT